MKFTVISREDVDQLPVVEEPVQVSSVVGEAFRERKEIRHEFKNGDRVRIIIDPKNKEEEKLVGKTATVYAAVGSFCGVQADDVPRTSWMNTMYLHSGDLELLDEDANV